MKHALETIRKFIVSFRSNLGLKIVSVLFAIILWNYVIAEVNPYRTRSFYNVPVVFQGEGGLKQASLSIKGDRGTLLKPVDVAVKIRRSDYGYLRKSDLRVYVDLNGITSEGEHRAQIYAVAPRGEVLRTSPDNVTVTVEKMSVKRVPVEVVPTGTLPEGYWSGEPVVTPSVLELTGAATDIQSVERARVEVSLDNLTGSINAPRSYTLLDAKGAELVGMGLEPSAPNCIVQLQVYPKKTVRVVATPDLLAGKVASGYEIKSVEVFPEMVEIAGPADKIEAMDVVPVPYISVEGLQADKPFAKTLELPENVRMVSGIGVTVTVKVQPIMTQVTLEDLPVTVIGLANGLKVRDKLAASVIVTCPELVARNVRAGKVHLYVDATGLAAGTHTLPIRTEVDSSLQSAGSQPRPATLNVTITS